MNHDLARRAGAEVVGTALLLVAVVGSGIAAEQLSPGDTGLQLFESAIATGAALVAIILAIGPVSGAHLNPLVTLIDRAFGGISSRAALVYSAAQIGGALLGVALANLMFDRSALEWSSDTRSGFDLWLSESVATFGLLLVVFGVSRAGRAAAAPFAVGAYIAGAYFFTSSTSFANPAVTLARSLTDSFSGIAPASVPAFLLAQLVGAGVALLTIRVLYPSIRLRPPAVVVPPSNEEALS